MEERLKKQMEFLLEVEQDYLDSKIFQVKT